MLKNTIFAVLLVIVFQTANTKAFTGVTMDIRVVGKSPDSYIVETVNGKIKIKRPAHSESVLEHGIKTYRLVKYFIPSEAQYIEKYTLDVVRPEKIKSIRF